MHILFYIVKQQENYFDKLIRSSLTNTDSDLLDLIHYVLFHQIKFKEQAAKL